MLRVLVLALLAVAVLASCQSSPMTNEDTSGKGKGTSVDSLDEGLVEANTRFAFNLFDEVWTEKPDANLFISPPSVSIALTMTYNGAAEETRTAMADALQITGTDLDALNRSYAGLISLLENPDSNVDLSIANSLWAREGLPFKEDFLQRNRDYFHARIEELDFNASDAAPTINGWVNDQTRGKINAIVDDPIDPSLIMFLINAIYFKGTWTTEFPDSLTEDQSFTLADGRRIDHPLMHQSDMYQYLKGDDFQAVSLPYSSGRISMYVFLPDRESDLTAFLSRLDEPTWKQWMTSFGEREGTVALPRFKLEYSTELKKALTALGMGVAFSESGADFSNMFPIGPGANVYISKVKHKSFVEVNEKGTEAAAVTSVEIGITSIGPNEIQPFYMTVDRPFFFAIRDNRTGVILFMGAIFDPSQES